LWIQKEVGCSLQELSSCATVVWHKINLFKKIGTQGNCGPRSKLTAAGIRITQCAGVAWLRRVVFRKDCTRANVERATQGVGTFRKNLGIHHEGKCGTKDLGGKQPPYMRKKRATVIGIGGWSSGHQSHLGSGGTLKMILYAICRRKIAKQVATSSGL
jgi:hypothetical protein